jgi:cytochrome c553
MNSRTRLLIACLMGCAFVFLAFAQNPSPPPYWAFTVNPDQSATAKSPDTAPQHVPGSTASFTLAQVHDLYNTPDWHPDAHPPMPPIVAHGRPPEVFACGYCHLPNGEGRPENSRLAGLPAGYIIRQIADFKSGQRKCSEPRHAPGPAMIAIASKATDQEIREAAAYFSSLQPKSWIRVVETSTVPKTHVDGWMLVASDPAASEPIGQRIIEMAENLERTELRDDTSGFVAYVPEGSLKRGKELVTTGGSGRTVACAKCHGIGLRGTGNVPPIAGRSPSYIVRQLFDIQSGARTGVLAQQMRKPTAQLTLDDMVAIAAYAASLRP